VTIRGKSVNLFLMDGTPTRRIKCTLSNWTGVAYKIPLIFMITSLKFNTQNHELD